MTPVIQRRNFLVGSLAAATAATATRSASSAGASPGSADPELCEVRVYRNSEADKRAGVLAFVDNALRPALNRQGIDRVGVFTPVDASDASVYLVIPYTSARQLIEQNDRLEADAAYHQAAASHFALPQDNPPYARVESRLLRTFTGMPAVVAPPQESGERVVELRIYEAHNAHRARLKVEMFNQGEIELMQDVGLAPVFFGETLIAGDLPNLTYMLSADSLAAHKEHWAAFFAHPEWDRMKELERYRDTVSHIVSVTLTPAASSQL